MSANSNDSPSPAPQAGLKQAPAAAGASRWQVCGIIGVAALLFCGIAWRNPLCRETVVDLLGRTGSWSIPWLLAAMEDSDMNVQKVALEGITRAGPIAVPTLLNNLQSSRPERRSLATRILSINSITAGKEADVCSALLPLLNETGREPRFGAMTAIASLGSHGKPAISALNKLLEQTDLETQQTAFHGIIQIAPSDPATLELILKLLNHPRAELRAQACGELEELETKDPRVVTALIERLRDPSPGVRLAAADYLGEMGLVAQPALEPLRNLAESDPDPDVRRKAQQGVRGLSKPPTP